VFFYFHIFQSGCRRCAVSNLERFESEPDDFVPTTMDIFGRPLIEDDLRRLRKSARMFQKSPPFYRRSSPASLVFSIASWCDMFMEIWSFGEGWPKL